MMKRATPNAAEKLLALLQEAISLHNMQKLDEADAIYKKVLLQAPRHADALHLRALVFHAKERFADAARFAEAAIAVAPQVANFHNTAGEAWRREGRLDLAQKYLQQAIRLDPSIAMPHLNLSLVLGSTGRHKEALACAEQALKIMPGYSEAMSQALAMHCALDDLPNAFELAQRLASEPDSPGRKEALGRYHNHLARRHRAHQRWDEAAREIDKALAWYPEFWGNWAVLAEASNDALDFSNAELYCAIAANLAPDNEDARLNIGHLLQEQKRLDEAESHYAAWLDVHPESAAARFGLASVKLMRGDLEPGWNYYEARWDLRRHGGGMRITAVPQWDGTACARLLLYAEQGLGDTIQMLRFLPEVVRRSAGAITLRVPQPLLRIAQRALGAQAIAVLTELPPDAVFDRCCPLMSLPHVLEAHTAGDLGMPAPYLAAESERIDFFKSLLSSLDGKKIGIVWQGGAAGLTNRRRPFDLDALAPLLAVPGISLVSLQFGVSTAMIGTTAITSLSAHIGDFDDLAAAMMALDAVVSVDTGPAHLAGALGLPTYTIVPWLHDWRWGIDGETTYWYPGMTLVRQTTPSEWTSTGRKLAALFDPASPAPDGASALSAFPQPQDRVISSNVFPLVHMHCGGETVAAPLLDTAATRYLLVYGEYLPQDGDVLSSCLRPGDTVLDIGAGVGEMAMVAARKVGPEGSVIALEADRLRHQCLAENARLNHLPWLEVRRQQAGKKPGKTKVMDAPAASKARVASESIDLVSLDSLGLSRCALVAINAHGSALDVLDGARTLIKQCQPALYLRCSAQDATAAAVKVLHTLGYQVFQLPPPAFRAENYRKFCDVDLFPDVAPIRLLALAPGAGPAPDGATQL